MEKNGNVSSWTVCTNCGHPLRQNISVNPILQPSSPLEELLNFTGVPSASDAVHVRVALEQTKSDMEKLDEEIGALESALTRLRNDREVLEKQSQRLEAVFAPVRRLPADVLIQIFHLLSTIEIRKANNVALLALCHVSRVWRAIALSTSSLWTHISIRVPDNDRAMESQAAAVQHWLTYSGDSPLYVDICGAKRDSSLPRNPALELLILQSHRWKDASLTLELDELSHYFRGVKGRLGQLGSLTMQLHGQAILIDYFEDAPSLTTFFMEGLGRSGEPFPISLPWDSLTHITTDFSSLTILQQCSSLVSCDLALWEEPTINLVELPHLRSFTMCNYTSRSLGWFYDSLSFPVLHTFDLDDPWETNSGHIASFLSRSSQALERLTLWSVCPTFNITDCLQVTPRLKYLTINPGPGGGIMSLHHLSLDLTSSTNTLLPELEILEFKVLYIRNEMSAVFDDAFVAMILSRLSAGGAESVIVPSPRHESNTRLRIVVIVMGSRKSSLEDPLQEEGIFNFLRLCREGGVDVSVSSADKEDLHIELA